MTVAQFIFGALGITIFAAIEIGIMRDLSTGRLGWNPRYAVACVAVATAGIVLCAIGATK